MWCTLHLQDGNEKKTEEFVTNLLPEDICTRCFHITRRRLRKREGQWREESEELLPGYVFIETSQPEAVYRELKKASKYLLFSDDHFVSVLKENDRKFLNVDSRMHIDELSDRNKKYLKYHRENVFNR